MTADALRRHWPHMKFGIVSALLNLLTLLLSITAASLGEVGLWQHLPSAFVLLWWIPLLAAFVLGWIGLAEDDRATLAALSMACSVLQLLAVLLMFLLPPV
jgi:hypothetical protein